LRMIASAHRARRAQSADALRAGIRPILAVAAVRRRC
jgi:hypothetical protein